MEVEEQRGATDERGASDLLDSLGVDKVLQELGVTDVGASGALNKLGAPGGASARATGASSNAAPLGLDQIYREDYESDEELGEEDESEREARALQEKSIIEANERYFAAGLAGIPAGVEQRQPVLGPEEAAQALREMLPTFSRGATLDFTELFLGRTANKRRRLGQYRAHFLPDPRPANAASAARLASVATAQHSQRGGPQRPGPAAELSYIEAALRDPGMLLDDWPEHISRSVPEARIRLGQEDSDWQRRLRWRSDLAAAEAPALVLDLNDAEMIFETETTGAASKGTEQQVLTTRAARAAAALNPLNLSNDRFYELPREHRQKVRQTLGQLMVQHARPALKLQLPWYKMRLSKTELRSFHRPAMQFPVNVPILFSKVTSSRKRREDRGKARKGRDPAEILRRSRDLTLSDTSTYVMYEYSEETPLMLSNFGMGHVLVHYYRKQSPKDETIPKNEIGEPFILDVSDDAPYFSFGQVEPGQTQATLYNNLVRAPLFKQDARHGDFLLIRHVSRSNIQYFLRTIPHVYTVGQVLPAVTVPGPYARLTSNTIKTRLHLIAHKLVQRSERERIKIHRIMRYFPDQNELQMRQRLKEFMEYNRRAGDPDQGFWKLKPNIVVPDEEELLKQLPPEHMVLYENMQAGQQRLLDAGLTKTVEDADDDADGNEIEQVLAPWTMTKNFINGAQGKAMLALHGDGDPSGRGDAFSFVRVSMKEVFLAAADDTEERRAAIEAEALSKSGHKYNVAEQQQIYRSEVARIWNQQKKVLSRRTPPKITAQDLQPLHRATRAYNAEIRANQAPSQTATFDGEDDVLKDLQPGKALKIRRKRDGVWRTEIVRDQGVIRQYMQQRRSLNDTFDATEALVPTGDAVLDAERQRRLAAEIEQLQRHQERRMKRAQGKSGAAAEPVAAVKPAKTVTKRSCGRCGAVGHTASNSNCPLFPRAPQPEAAEDPISSKPSPSPATGGTGTKLKITLGKRP